MTSDLLREINIHLVSDATGSTLQGLARACFAQFDNVDPLERFWPLVRTEKQLDRVIQDISENLGPVLFTLVDEKMRKKLHRECDRLEVPCIPILDPLIKSMSSYLGMVPKGVPGLQHALDDAYFKRVDAIDFALSFDDGQNFDGIEDSEVVLVGVSRTSKTPTCIFLARRGIRASNIPFVPGVPFPEHVLENISPLIVGLTESPERLVQLRRSRLKAEEKEAEHKGNAYLDPFKVEEEIKNARRFFSKRGWPVIDVTRRSVEETAAEIQILLQKKKKLEKERLAEEALKEAGKEALG